MFSPEETRQRWQGVVIPLVVIFGEDLSLDLEATARHVEWIMGKGAGHGNSVFLVATGGGDFSAMTLAERKEVIRVTAEVVDGRASLIAGAQSTDIRDTIAICQFCEDVGVEAVQISGPYYYAGRPTSWPGTRPWPDTPASDLASTTTGTIVAAMTCPWNSSNS